MNGIRLHYVAGGQGEPLILLPGWPETWWEYHTIMPTLAARYRVIVVELRGMGGSDKPQSGFDKKTMASDIHELARTLGYDTVNISGHDIGSMVAFSFAVNHPEATRKVALLDVTHPDQSYNQLRLLPQPGAPIYPWWFAFNQVRGLPEQLVSAGPDFLSTRYSTICSSTRPRSATATGLSTRRRTPTRTRSGPATAGSRPSARTSRTSRRTGR